MMATRSATAAVIGRAIKITRNEVKMFQILDESNAGSQEGQENLGTEVCRAQNGRSGQLDVSSRTRGTWGVCVARDELGDWDSSGCPGGRAIG
ncbi:MAG TPA: hypothetical protein VMW56_03385, partial [Candidatus Margulisiibacteriota bacterium]|nr:hypothetical protein [Candidatus Margulisiibacteriota bacterium]